MADADRDQRLRSAAANRGFKLVKSRRRTPGVGDYGRYGLTDQSGKELFGFGRSGLTATAEEIEEYLHKGLVSDWKSSLKAEGGKAPPKAAAKSAPKRGPSPPPAANDTEPEPPEPQPEPQPELRIREAKPADAQALSALIGELGFEASASDLRARLASLRKAGGPPLVAERGELVGCLTWHVMTVLHRPAPVGRITMMVVTERERRGGVGRALVQEAAARCAAKGCGLLEVTSNIELSAAHGFYRKLGFERTSYRFARALGEEK
jgi:ribosomal protein S18 acetylase RimI-like enzyme